METKLKNKVSRWLAETSSPSFILWCAFAAFGAYFCMYAFRKPFNMGHYDGLKLWGMD